jgi:SPP1 gp7 family putative phage head morphogenesis protein
MHLHANCFHVRKPLRFSSVAVVSKAAARVDFATIADTEQQISDGTVPTVAQLVAKAVQRALGSNEQIASLLDDDPTDIGGFQIGTMDVTRIQAAFHDALETAYQHGQQTAQGELGKAGHVMTRMRFASLRDNAAAYLQANSFRMADNVTQGARSIIQAELLNGVKAGVRVEEVVTSIYDKLVRKGFTTPEAVLGLPWDQAYASPLAALWKEGEVSDLAHYLQTLVRTNTFPALDGFVVAFEYSAIIDDVTTDICLELDGKVFAADSDEWDMYRPPNHYNCRSVLIPVTEADGWDGKSSPVPTITPQEGFFAPRVDVTAVEPTAAAPAPVVAKPKKGALPPLPTVTWSEALPAAGAATKQTVVAMTEQLGIKSRVDVKPIKSHKVGSKTYTVLGNFDERTRRITINESWLKVGATNERVLGTLLHENGHAALSDALGSQAITIGGVSSSRTLRRWKPRTARPHTRAGSGARRLGRSRPKRRHGALHRRLRARIT